MSKYSIVIPTFNHCDDLLKPCVESIIKFTELSNVEIIIVANGCTDNTIDYISKLGSPFKLIVSESPLGYTKATNLGIHSASGEYVILMNNDVILLPQEKNTWISMLENPFLQEQKTGITGPVKFFWKCGQTTRTSMAFWLVMMRKSLFSEIGLLDEIFSPGMGEDGDFSIRTELAGYRLVGVPNDVLNDFDQGIRDFNFPVYHTGNGTFADNTLEKNEIIQRNINILEQRYGKELIDVSIIVPTCDHFDDALKPCIDAILKYTDFSNKELIVVCNGSGENTKNYLDSLGNKVKYFWNNERLGVIRAYNIGIENARGKHIVLIDDDSILMPQAVDDWINILKKPFMEDKTVGASSPFANDYVDLGLVLHSGCTMYDAELLRKVGMFDEIYHPGYFSDSDVSMKVWRAGYKCVEVPRYNPDKSYESGMFAVEFPVVHTGTVQTMDKNKDIEIVRKNREILYGRYSKKFTKYSIVIPTYNHCDDLLKPCIESIEKYTDISNVEIIVVANGCTDNTREYVESLGNSVKLIWVDEAIGYTKATNLGIQKATGEYVILLNNDTELLAQQQNEWLMMLEEPFKDPKVGLTGPLELFDNYANSRVLIFFCVMIRRELFNKIGLLDEIFTPGGGEDIDFTVRANLAGYKSVAISQSEFSAEARTNVGVFPIWHKDNKTFGDIPEYTKFIVKRNGLINCKRYNKNIKLNLGAGGIDYNGYLSVDLYDPRALIKMDITKLDFDDDSVTEILASHVFEHLNPYHVLDILRDWLRVLKPGGKIVMEMPNIEALCQRFVTAPKAERYGILNAVYGSVNTTGIGGPDNITSPHLFGWWPDSLFDHMYEAGFRDIVFMDEKIPHPESNFRVEAMKPYPEKKILIDREGLKAQEPSTYAEVFENNEYSVQASEIENKTIIDIGANVGLFSLMCLEYGAKKIIAVEAQPTIFNLGLVPNTKKYPQIFPLNFAVHSQDNEVVNIINYHVGSHISEIGDPVSTITLRKLLKDNQIEENDLILKLDCEGSEYDILMNIDRETLRKFSIIYMEVHSNMVQKTEYKVHRILENKLETHGYRCDNIRYHTWKNESGQEYPGPISVQKWVRV